jgi:hypothetical protein
MTEMEIVYTELALEDLRSIPKRFAAQIVAKIHGSNMGCAETSSD